MVVIYGIDTLKPVSVHDVRNAIIECLKQAHSQELDELMSDSAVSAQDVDSLKKLNVTQLMRSMMALDGNDFENPTKQALSDLVERLKLFAGSFRTQDVVVKHAHQISALIRLIPESA